MLRYWNVYLQADPATYIPFQPTGKYTYRTGAADWKQAVQFAADVFPQAKVTGVDETSVTGRILPRPETLAD